MKLRRLNEKGSNSEEIKMKLNFCTAQLRHNWDFGIVKLLQQYVWAIIYCEHSVNESICHYGVMMPFQPEHKEEASKK